MPRTRTYPIVAPYKGLRKDIPPDLIGKLEMSDCKNVFFEDGLVKKRHGSSQKGTNLPLSGAITGIDQYYDFQGNEKLFAATSDDVYEYNTTFDTWEHRTPSTVLDNCDDAWVAGSGDTVAADTDDAIEGSGSVKITLVAERSDGDKLAYENISSTDIGSHTHIGFWLKSDTALAAEALDVVVSEWADAGKLGTYTECASTALAADTWTFVRLTKTLTLLNAVVSVGLYAGATIASGVVLHIDDVRAYTPLSASDSDLCSYDQMLKVDETDPWWIFTNGVDDIQKFAASGNMQDLGGSPPKAKHLIEFKDYLVLFDTTEGGNRLPQRMRWSDTGDPEEWNAGNASYINIPGADWLQGARKLKGDYLAILKKDSTWIARATGDSDIFEIELKDPDAGCAAPRTIQNIRDEVAFLGEHDVYSFDGVICRSLTKEQGMRREIIDSINPAQLSRCFALTVKEKDEYWLFVVTSGNTYPATAWVYNYRLGSWTKNEYADSLTMYGFYKRQASVTIDSLTGTIDEQDWRLDDRTILASYPTVLFGDSAGYVFEYLTTIHNDDDAAIDAHFATKDFNLTLLGRQQRVLRVDVSWKGTALDIYYSTDQGATYTLIKSLSASNDLDPEQLSFRISSDWLRLRFRNNASKGWFHFNRANIYWQPGGRL